MTPYPLQDEQVRFYQENGYLRLENVLTPAEVAAARVHLAEAMAGNAGLDRTGRSEYDRVFLQKVNLWRDHAGIRQLVLHPRLGEVARRLAQVPCLRLWHDHALIKPHLDSKASPWHQDLPYWPMDERGTGCLSCWIALDDVDEVNGCMHFVPQSHTWGKLEPINLANPQDIFSLVPEPEGKSFTPVRAPLRAGSCTFHNALTFHYAPPNRGEAPRRAMILIYMPDGVGYTGKRHPVTDPLNLEPGQPLAGEMFPVVAEA